jgi:transitional endoplasmic reticulum ATPase
MSTTHVEHILTNTCRCFASVSLLQKDGVSAREPIFVVSHQLATALSSSSSSSSSVSVSVVPQASSATTLTYGSLCTAWPISMEVHGCSIEYDDSIRVPISVIRLLYASEPERVIRHPSELDAAASSARNTSAAVDASDTDALTAAIMAVGGGGMDMHSDDSHRKHKKSKKSKHKKSKKTKHYSYTDHQDHDGYGDEGHRLASAKASQLTRGHVQRYNGPVEHPTHRILRLQRSWRQVRSAIRVSVELKCMNVSQQVAAEMEPDIMHAHRHAIRRLRFLLMRKHVCKGCIIRLRDDHGQVTHQARVIDTYPRNVIVQLDAKSRIEVGSPSTADEKGSATSGTSLSNNSSELFSSDSETVVNLNAKSAAIRALYEVLYLPLIHASDFDQLHIDFPKGILLHGPPGVGKTWAVRTITNSLHIKMLVVDGARVADGGVAGQGIAELRAVFAEANNHARRTRRPTLVFIDEIEALCPKRSSDNTQAVAFVAQLLTLMDGLQSREHVIVVGATNRPNALDPALRRPGRFDRELEIPAPDQAERLQIFKYYAKNMQLAPDVDLHTISEQAVGYVGADIEAMCREAATRAVLELRRTYADVKHSSDTVIVSQQHFNYARHIVVASSQRGHILQLPKVTWEDIGGLEYVKERFRQAVEWPLHHSKTMQRLGLRPSRGILLHGPPGCSKTTLARACANAASLAFFAVSASSVMSSYLGESEQLIRRIFSRARANSPCVVFIDELDALFSSRAKQSQSGDQAMERGDEFETRLLATLLNEMDGISDRGQILVMGATNRLDMLDEALLRPGRFDQLIYVPPPDQETRLSILKIKASTLPLADDVSLADIAQSLTLGYSGADIENLCREAAMLALRRSVTDSIVMTSDFECAAKTVPASLLHLVEKGDSSYNKK